MVVFPAVGQQLLCQPVSKWTGQLARPFCHVKSNSLTLSYLTQLIIIISKSIHIGKVYYFLLVVTPVSSKCKVKLSFYILDWHCNEN